MYVRLKLSTTAMFHSPADMDDVLRKRVAWTSIGAEACNLLPTEPSRTTARSNPDLYVYIPTEISWDVRRNARLLVKLWYEMLHWRMREGRVCADFTYTRVTIHWSYGPQNSIASIETARTKFTFFGVFWHFLWLHLAQSLQFDARCSLFNVTKLIKRHNEENTNLMFANNLLTFCFCFEAITGSTVFFIWHIIFCKCLDLH